MYLDFAGSETVARENIMEPIERAKFGINDQQNLESMTNN